MTRRIIAVVLALSLLVVSASASAYYVEDDTEVLYLENSDEPYVAEEDYAVEDEYEYEDDYSVSTYTTTYDLTSTESAYLANISDYVELLYNWITWGFDTNLDSIWSRQGTVMNNLATRTGVYFLYYNGSDSGYSTTTSSTTMNDIIRYGFLGLYDKLGELIEVASDETVLTGISGTLDTVSTNVSTASTRLANIYSRLGNLKTSLENVEAYTLDLISSVATETTLSAISDKVATETTLSAISDKVATETTLFDGLYIKSGDKYLNSSGYTVTSDSSKGIGRFIGAGFVGLSSFINLDADSTYLNPNGYRISTSNAIGIDKVVASGFSGLSTYLDLDVGSTYLTSSGYRSVSEYATGIDKIVGAGFAGLSTYLDLDVGSTYLTSSGYRSVSEYATGIDKIVGAGFAGLGALLSGSEIDNIYSGTITSNENTETSFNSTGLGPMLNTYMDAIQNDTGLLAYMFASPTDLEIKADSADVSKGASDSFFSGDAEGAKIDLNTISGAKDVLNGATDLFDTGYGLKDIFTLWDDSSYLSWFSSETAYALDTTVQALAVDDEDPYNMQIYYDQINAIAEKRGEGNDG